MISNFSTHRILTSFEHISNFISAFLIAYKYLLFRFSFQLVLTNCRFFSLISELNKIFDMCSLHVCVSHYFTFLKIILQHSFLNCKMVIIIELPHRVVGQMKLDKIYRYIGLAKKFIWVFHVTEKPE